MLKHTFVPLEKFHANRISRKTMELHPVMKITSDSQVDNFNIKSKIQSVYDQGQIGSCTTNAICQALRITRKYHNFSPSRLYLYAKERIAEAGNDVPITDSGADAADGLNQLLVGGVCSEAIYPYDVSKVNDIPPASCDEEALNHKIHKIGRVVLDSASAAEKIAAIEHVIKSGIPVLIGIVVYPSFESQQVASDGNVPIPDTQNEQSLGGHEVLIVGYDHIAQKFTLVNSWGDAWGDHGFFTLDYAYVTDPNLTSEFICITEA